MRSKPPLKKKRTWEQLVTVFWKRVNKNTDTDCWEWTGALNKWGYGHIKWFGLYIGAHQLSFMIHDGEIPDGMKICHTCDNPKCVHPRHLYCGTDQDNVNDRVARKRSAVLRGERNGNARFTDEEAERILAMMSAGLKPRRIMAEMGLPTLPYSTLHNLKKRQERYAAAS